MGSDRPFRLSASFIYPKWSTGFYHCFGEGGAQWGRELHTRGDYAFLPYLGLVIEVALYRYPREQA